MTEEIQNTPTSLRRMLKKRARHLVFSDWVKHIFSFLIVGACYVGILQFGSSVSILLQNLTGDLKSSALFYSVYLTLAFVIVVPLVYGLLCFEINSVDENKGNLGDLLCAFSSYETLNRSYKLFFCVLLRVLLAFLPAILLGIFISAFYHSGIFGFSMFFFSKDVVYFALETFQLVFLYFGFAVSCKNFVGIYVSIKREKETLKECFFVANVCSKDSRGQLCTMALSFVPLFVVSLFTMGFLFFLYTGPYILLSFIMFSEYLYTQEMVTHNAQSVLYEKENEENQKEIINDDFSE